MKKADSVKYAAIPFVHGLFEFQVKNLKRDFAEIVFSNYLAMVASAECTGCEICLDRCQMNALRINAEDVAEVNKDRCIGCGLCVTTCDTEAIRLIPKSETEYHVPPANSAEQMMSMAQKRGLIEDKLS